MDYDLPTSPSLRNKMRSSACFSCCFRSAAAAADDQPPPLPRSSSTWIRWKTHELPEIKSRRHSVMARVGKHRHRRHQSDFRYDPLSYALNFDEGNEDDGEFPGVEEIRHRSFSSRLPASPPRKAAPPAVGVAYG